LNLSLESVDLDEIDNYLSQSSDSPSHGINKEYLLQQFETLSQATKSGYKNTIENFVQRVSLISEFQLTFQNEVGDTALHFATLNSNYTMLNSVLKHFPRLQIQKALRIYNKTGFSPYHISAALLDPEEDYQVEIVESLLSVFDTKDGLFFPTNEKDQRTGLHLAASYGNYNSVDIILELAEKEGVLEDLVNFQDLSGNSAVMHAAKGDHKDIVQVLLFSEVANLQLTNKSAQTALSLAVLYKHRQISIMLYQYNQNRQQTQSSNL